MSSNGLSRYCSLFRVLDCDLGGRSRNSDRNSRSSVETPAYYCFSDDLSSFPFFPYEILNGYPAIVEGHFPRRSAREPHFIFRSSERKAWGLPFDKQSAYPLGTFVRICAD